MDWALGTKHQVMTRYSAASYLPWVLGQSFPSVTLRLEGLWPGPGAGRRFLDFLVKSPLRAFSLIPISNTWQDLIFLGQHETVSLH